MISQSDQINVIGPDPHAAFVYLLQIGQNFMFPAECCSLNTTVMVGNTVSDVRSVL